MASWICLSVYIITAFVLESATGARLTTSPTQIAIGGSNPTSQLTVSCSPDAPGITQVYSIEIGKKSSTGSNQPIIRITNTDSSVQVVDTGLQQRMTVSGSITGATGSIQFILSDLRCTDAASTYYCNTLYLIGAAGNDEATTNVTARTYPEQIQMFPTPDRSSYDEGEMISFRCTGSIGNQFDENNLQSLWTWEYRSIDNEFTSWTRYPNDQNITYETPTPVSVSGGCQYNGASTLLHTVSNLDNGRQFRCSVISEDYSANKTVLVVGQQPIGTPAPGENASVATTTTPSTTTSTSTQSPPSGKTDAVEPGPTGVSRVYGITLTGRDETGIKGPNPVAVKCEYVLAQGEILFSITMSRKRTTDPSYTDIAVFRPDVNSSLYGADVADDFKLRTTLIMSDGSTSVRFDRVECEDEAVYRCSVDYQSAGNTAETKTVDMNLLLQAQPLTPTITLTPSYADGYTDGQQVQFQCQGSVGKPAGDFLWFRYRGNTPEDITSLARLDPPYPSTGTCTSDRISQLTLNYSRKDNGMTIRCAANHTTLTKPTGSETCNSTCRQTDKIAVFYTFSDRDPDVSSNPAGGTHTVGDTVTLKCNADTNPPATFSWHKEGDNNSTTPGGEWTLSNLQIEDSGTYTCMATNVVGGVTYNASRSLNINVVLKPIIPSTTITATSRGPPLGNAGVVQPEANDTDNTVVIVVCVIISVLLITGVVTGVVFYRKRRGMKTLEDAHYERPYTALQRGTSVQQAYGVIRSETTQAPAQPRGFPVYVNESFDHAVGTTTTSVSRTDGPIYEECN